MTLSRFLFLLANFWITTSICVLVVAASRHAQTATPVVADWKARDAIGNVSRGVL